MPAVEDSASISQLPGIRRTPSTHTSAATLVPPRNNITPQITSRTLEVVDSQISRHTACTLSESPFEVSCALLTLSVTSQSSMELPRLTVVPLLPLLLSLQS